MEIGLIRSAIGMLACVALALFAFDPPGGYLTMAAGCVVCMVIGSVAGRAGSTFLFWLAVAMLGWSLVMAWLPEASPGGQPDRSVPIGVKTATGLFAIALGGHLATLLPRRSRRGLSDAST